MDEQHKKCAALAALHNDADAWVIPNPWDAGSARDLEKLGFKALATSSAAFAYTLGRKDGSVTLDDDAHPVRLINMGESPHSISSLGVLAGGYFFQSDLHVPNSDADEPRSNRAETECWFARWAVDRLPDDTVVINTHRLVQTPVSRLARYLESDSC